MPQHFYNRDRTDLDRDFYERFDPRFLFNKALTLEHIMADQDGFKRRLKQE